jgi:hypothetical protein
MVEMDVAVSWYIILWYGMVWYGMVMVVVSVAGSG